MYNDQGRHEPEDDEVRFIDKQQPCLGLNLRVGQRPLRQRHRGPGAENNALTRPMAFAPGAIQRDFEQPGGDVVALAHAQRHERQQPCAALRGSW